MMRGGAPMMRGGYVGGPVMMRGGIVMRGGIPFRGAPIMMRGGVPMGRAMPAYPVAAVSDPGLPAYPADAQSAQPGDAVDMLADLDEFGDSMQMGVSPRTAAGANPNSPFGSNTLAELDQLNNPEFY